MRGNRATRWLAGGLRRRLVQGVAARRPPDFVIGDDFERPYLRRWWVIPRNRFFNIYLHEFLRDDDDRALHDHPWLSWSLTLDGDLVEIYRPNVAAIHLVERSGDAERQVGTGDVIFRTGTFAHRMIVMRPSWTLFITGPVYREWGFLCERGWRHWKDFVARDNAGGVGRGCE